MSAAKSKIASKSSSSSSPPTTRVSPKPAAKTLFSYFTKLSKDKTENDLNESNRKRKLSSENNQLPPVKILKPSEEVLMIDDRPELEVTDTIEINEDSLENIIPNPVEEKKKLMIKFIPTNKKKDVKSKSAKRKSKDGKLGLSSDAMDVDIVVDQKSESVDTLKIQIEMEENKNVVDQNNDKGGTEQKSDSSSKFYAEDIDNGVDKKTDNSEGEVLGMEIQKEIRAVKSTLEEPSKLVKTPRRKSTRIENSQEKLAEVSKIIAETKLEKSEMKPRSTARKITGTEVTTKDQVEGDENPKPAINKTPDAIEVKAKNILIVSDDNSDGDLSGTISPSNNLNKLPHKLTASSEKKLTPKQIKYNESRRKAREDREKKIQEEREIRQKEKEEQRKKEREEKELKLKKDREEKEEQRKKEKAEKDGQRAKEREEKERKRLDEIHQKNEEKRKREEQKEEEKRKKEEERKKKEAEKEEEKREKEQERLKKEQEKLEEEQKKKREADKFKRFFRNSVDQTNPNVTGGTGGSTSIPSSQGNDTSNHATEAASNFMPFCIKGNMKLAPCTRKTLTDDQKVELEKIVNGEKLEKNSYFKQLKSHKYVIGKSEKTIPHCEDNEVIIIDDELDTIGDEVVELKPKQQKYRAKFFLFNGNRRPPYYGTWRKKSTVVKPCKPFEMDTKYFNYEVDSDDEWEDDEPGESLKGSDDDYESNDDYEVDNEFFVPHGYLSDEENKAEMEGDGVDNEENDNHPDTQKAKLKILQLEFFAEHSKKTEKIKPKLIGCIWQNLNADENDDKYPAIIHKLLENHGMIMNEPIILKPEIPTAEDNQTETATSIEFTNEEIQVLIKLIHGNVHKRQFLVEEYLASRAEKLEAGKKEKLTKVKISNKIREIAQWKRCVTDNSVMNNRYCWVVGSKQLDEFNLSDLDVFNTWKYTLKPLRTVTPASIAKEDSNDGTTLVVTTTTATATTMVNSITKYTTPISKLQQSIDRTNKTAASSSSSSVTKKSPTQEKSAIATTSTSSNPGQPTKKRVNLLMSVPRGQAFPQNKKNTLISEYLNNGKLNNNNSKNKVSTDDSVVNKSKSKEKTPNPEAAESDEILSMDCDMIVLD